MESSETCIFQLYEFKRDWTLYVKLYLNLMLSFIVSVTENQIYKATK